MCFLRSHELRQIDCSHIGGLVYSTANNFILDRFQQLLLILRKRVCSLYEIHVTMTEDAFSF